MKNCFSMLKVWAVGVLLCTAACHPTPMNTAVLPEIPDPAYAKGVSAPFCGVLGTAPVVAGGANFPDKPLLEGGSKKVYRDIWLLEGGAWKHAGRLPDSTAYGATFQLPDGLVFAGGNAAGMTTDRVYVVRREGEGVSLAVLPSLPLPVEQAGWTAADGCLYLAGGQSGEQASRKVYACTAEDFVWSEIAELPLPLVQPLAYAREGKLYVWGGFDPLAAKAFNVGWCLDLASGQWEAAPAIPDGGTFVGAAGVTLPDGRLLVAGGVHIDVFNRALHNTPEDRIPYLSKEPADYKFRQAVYLFDGKRWTQAGSSADLALAGPGIAAAADKVYVAGGEVKPGVRSPKILELKFE